MVDPKIISDVAEITGLPEKHAWVFFIACMLEKGVLTWENVLKAVEECREQGEK